MAVELPTASSVAQVAVASGGDAKALCGAEALVACKDAIAAVATGRDSEALSGDLGQEVSTSGPCFLAALARVLTQLASTTGKSHCVTRFHGSRVPHMSIQDYLTRIHNYFKCSPTCFVLCLVYIDRIMKLHPEWRICNLNIHRLLLTSIIVAAKFFDDKYYSNANYAKIGGLHTEEVNALEAEFLKLIKWQLHVTPQEYEHYRELCCLVTAKRAAGEPVACGTGDRKCGTPVRVACS